MLTFRLKKQLRHFTTEVTAQLDRETLVLIGHSGCGKSTLLKMLSGLLSPDAGEIEVNGRQLYNRDQNINLPPEERNIGYVFQNYALFPHLTVRENVAYGISHLSRQEQEQRVAETLAFLEIERLADSKPPMLSGGEQQRVAVARALVTKPQVLLLDEPLSALDVSTRSRVRIELKELLQQLSIPTIVVTHDFEDARVLADKVAVMNEGVIIQAGDQDEIARFPASPFVAQFTGTNLMPVSGGTENYVAFDPWKVQVSHQPVESALSWQGSIRDISFIGGFVRIQVDAETSGLPFYADIPIDSFDRDHYAIGETVYGKIRKEDARPIEVLPEFMAKKKEKPAEPKIQPAKKRQWNWKIPSLAAAVLLASLISIFAFQANSESAAEETEVLALVAANATSPFEDLMEEFERTHPNVNVQATFAGTQVVRTQLEQGANADLFLSADLGHIEAVQEQGLVDEFFPVSLNSVIIVVPKENPLDIDSLEDLGTKDVKLVIGTDTVPIGIYTREVFNNANAEYGADFSDRAMANVVSFETNVKQVLQKVALGEAEAGVVYRTDVTPDFAKNVTEIPVPEEFNIIATNYISVPVKAPHPELAEEFMEMMLSEKGQAIFEEYDYTSINQEEE